MEDNRDQRPDRVAMRGEVRRLMEARIDTLPDAFRTVFMLRAVEELSVEEIAVAPRQCRSAFCPLSKETDDGDAACRLFGCDGGA